MTINSYGGEGTSISGGYKFLDAGYSFSEDGNWNSANVGWSFFSPLDYGGTFSHTFTSVQKLTK